MRTAAKRDTTEPAIIAALEAAGASVARLSANGLPDLLVGYHGQTILMECKSKGGRLTDAQRVFMAAWEGSEIHVVHSAEQALAILATYQEA